MGLLTPEGVIDSRISPVIWDCKQPFFAPFAFFVVQIQSGLRKWRHASGHLRLPSAFSRLFLFGSSALLPGFHSTIGPRDQR